MRPHKSPKKTRPASNRRRLKRVPQRRLPHSLWVVVDDPAVLRAIERFAAPITFVTLDGKKVAWPAWKRQVKVAKDLITLSLAHADVIAPRFRQMVRYCEAEGIEIHDDYLRSLIRAKFAKGLYHVWPNGDDDDDDDDPASPAPQPIGTPSTATK